MTAPAVEFENVSFAYTRGEAVLEDVSLRVERGERLGLLGPNGGGKTTLLHLALGLIEPDAGAVRVGGMSPTAARKKGLVGALLQSSAENDALPVTAREVVTLGATIRLPAWKRTGAALRDRIGKALELVDAREYADRLYRELSGGQRQRVRIARAIAAGAEILMLDEPLVGVDPAGQRRFADLIERVRAEMNLTLMIVSHDVRAVAAGCDRIACLSRTLHYHATPEGLTPAVLGEVFQHDVAAIFGDVHVHAHPADECPMDHGQEHGGGGGKAS